MGKKNKGKELEKKRTDPFGVVLVTLVVGWFAFFHFHTIDLTTADLGRHIKNGELIFQNPSLLRTNFYSYTHPEFPFINHHWGSGVVFYLVERAGGFQGLSLLNVVVSSLTFLLFLFLARKHVGWDIAAVLALPMVPLLTGRTEIRPEMFSYLLCGVFFGCLWGHRMGWISSRRLWLLPCIELVWVNLHIYFFMGLVLIGIFLLEAWVIPQEEDGQARRRLGLVLLASAAVSLVNPFGWNGLIAPFRIFENYGYRVLENQSVWFLERIIYNPNFLLFKVVFGLGVLSFLGVAVKNWRNLSIPLLVIYAMFSAMAWLAIRNFAVFGFFTLPILAYNIRHIISSEGAGDRAWPRWAVVIVALVFLGATMKNQRERFHQTRKRAGVGLAAGNGDSAGFFRRAGIQGPLFNNYDIGGYLIYFLFPEHRVFVDNRPETYPASFFQEVYVPMQEDEAVWKTIDDQYRFNAIFFSHRDATPWGQHFLIERVQDPRWVPVFADAYAIIFLRNIPSNRPTIERHQIPRDRFRIIKNR